MKTAILVSVIALLVSFSVAAYKFALLLDSGIALDDARSEVDRQRDRANRILIIVKRDWAGRPVGDVVKLSDEFHDKGVIVKVQKDRVEIEDVVFEIENGSVVDVHYFD